MTQANDPSRPAPIPDFRTPPSLEDFERLAAHAFLTIPADLREKTETILFRIEDFPDDEICRDMELASPFDLLGLYQGVDLAHKSMADTMPDPDVIYLFRRPILDYWCETGEDLNHLIRHVLVHEIGHHFGLSDADMEELERLPDDV